ncbi:MAG: hypothetical protein HY778_02850 [Betaproteobacteria bacterium]|nr:hypothetical protein [Betaproteobacteria bacterium]
MTVHKIPSAIIATFLLTSAAAFAQQGPQPMTSGQASQPAAAPGPAAGEGGGGPDTLSARFQALDANADGYVNRQEAVRMRGLAERFDGADANKDGRLDPVEFGKAMGR